MDVLETPSELPLPEAFLDFLNKNGLDPSVYSLSHPIPRYLRLKPGYEAYIEEIEAEIKCQLERVTWLPGFYSIPPHIQIANSKAYQQGKIYGVDAASGAAVMALGISQGDHVLDLCAAPGAKLCMILDLLGSSGSATGVDVARHRLAACRTMLQKYGLGDQCRLFVANGTTFSIAAPTTQTCKFVLKENDDVYKEWTSRRPWKERKQAAKGRNSQLEEPDLLFYGRNSGVSGRSRTQVYKTLGQSDVLHYGYDKVLVDAECTHDGSIKHIQKFEQWGWTTLQRRVFDAARTDDLAILQLQLLINGFRLLKVGGSLVYSTCSLTVAQNEDIVEQFLSQNASAVLLDIDASKTWPCRSGRLPKALRFDPMTSRTSGLFVAKFTKLSHELVSFEVMVPQSASLGSLLASICNCCQICAGSNATGA